MASAKNLEVGRATAAKVEGQQEAQHVDGDELRQTGEIEADVDHCHRKEHEVQGRNRDPGLGQRVEQQPRLSTEIAIEKQQHGHEGCGPPAGGTRRTGRILENLQHPGQRVDAAAAVLNDRIGPQQRPEQAATHHVLGRQQQDEDEQDRQHDLREMEQVAQGDPHLFGQSAGGFDTLLS